MKNIILITGIIFLVTNLLIGMIISFYPNFNMWLNCVVIGTNTILLYSLNMITLKDAFKISLSSFFAIMGIIEFILGMFAPEQMKDNWYLIIIIIALLIKAILLVITNMISKTVK